MSTLSPSLRPSHRTADCGTTWAAVKNWGRVLERCGKRDGPRYWLDFGRYGKIYSHKGLRFESREKAEALLETIRTLTQEVGKRAAIDQFAATASKQHRIGLWLQVWLADFEEQVNAGERAPRTLREYRRWAAPRGHFYFWKKRSIHSVGPLSSREYIKWLRMRGISGKTAWNVVGGFRAFLGWLVDVHQHGAFRRRESLQAGRCLFGHQPVGEDHEQEDDAGQDVESVHAGQREEDRP